MIHRTNADFWNDYRELPAAIRARADKQFALLKENPQHPSLHFKMGTGVPGWEPAEYIRVANRWRYADVPRGEIAGGSAGSARKACAVSGWAVITGNLILRLPTAEDQKPPSLM